MSRSHRLRNTTTRPVQLHLDDGVTVVPALGVASCATEDLGLGQIRVLRRNGVLVLVELPPETEPGAPSGEAQPVAEHSTRARRQPRGGRTKRPKAGDSETNS